MALPLTSKTIAMNLRQALYLSSKGATFNAYPNGPGTRPVRVPLPEVDRKAYARKRQELMADWKDTDPDGFALWRLAMASLAHGQEAHMELLTGWAAEIFESGGIRLVDPCAYCKECRATRATREA